MRNILLILGPALNLCSIVPYFIDVVHGKTKPNIVSWVTWTVLTGIGAIAVMSDAGFVSSLLPLSATLCTLSIVVLGTKYGFAKYTKFDVICQASAVVGLMLWAIFNSPLVALIAVIVIDAVAALPTLLHAYREPGEETWQAFGIGSVAALLTLLSVSAWTLGKVAYPIYLCVANGAITLTIIGLRAKRGIALSRKA